MIRGSGPRSLRTLPWLPFWAAVAVGLALRLVLLGDRPLHHDEGVNAWFLTRIFDGYQFSYDPGKFHGTFLVFFQLPFALLLGESVTALRIPVALVSTGMMLLLLPLRRRLGVAGITGAAWLLAVSPSFVSYGRDFIHETFLVFLTLALVVVGSSWLETRRERDLILAALCLGLLATVKETYVLTLAVMAIAAILARAWGHGRPGLRELWGLPSRRALGRAALAFGIPYVLLYTSFFTNPWGLPDSVRTFFLWAGKGIEGAEHAKPWRYFFRLLLDFEPVVMAAAAAGGWLALRRRDAFGTFCLLWTAGELAAYSLLRYKTPWLVLNIVLPAALAGGVLFREAWGQPWPKSARAGIVVLLVAGLGWGAWRTAEVSYLRYDDDRLALAYVPTHRDVKALMAQVRKAVRKIPPGETPRILIVGQHSWPLPWYFRDLQGMEYNRQLPETPDADVIVVTKAEEKQLRPRLGDRYSRREYQLRPREWVGVYVRDSFQKPGPETPPS